MQGQIRVRKSKTPIEDAADDQSGDSDGTIVKPELNEPDEQF